MSIELDNLRAFVVVAELGNFNRAAVVLSITQSALSRRIQKLEESLKVRLFERTTRSVALSRTGRDFLPEAKKLLNDLDSSIRGIREKARRTSEEVSIACISTAAYNFLPPIVEQFSSKFPDIRIRIFDEDANSILQTIIDGRVDLGINIQVTPEPGIEFEPLEKEPYVLACREDHPLASRATVDWSELESYRFIFIGRGTGNRLLLELGQSSVVGLSNIVHWPKWTYEVQHLITALGLVRVGVGVAALPRMAMQFGFPPNIISRPLVNPVLSRTLGIVRRQDRRVSPAAAKFLGILRKYMSEKKKDARQSL